MSSYFSGLVAKADVNLCKGSRKARYVAHVAFWLTRSGYYDYTSEIVVASSLRALVNYLHSHHDANAAHSALYDSRFVADIDDIQSEKQIGYYQDGRYTAV